MKMTHKIYSSWVSLVSVFIWIFLMIAISDISGRWEPLRAKNVVVGSSEQYFDSSELIYEVTDSNYESLVISSPNPWILIAYLPDCGICTRFFPLARKAAKSLNGIIQIGAFNAYASPGLVKKLKITRYPSVYFFPSSDKSAPLQFRDIRRYRELFRTAIKSMPQGTSLEINPVEISDLATLKKTCDLLENEWCLLFYVPSPSDKDRNIRDSMESIIKRAAGALRLTSVGVGYLTSGRHPQVESKLGLHPGQYGFAFFSFQRQKGIVYKGSFGMSEIRTFLRSVITGKRPLVPMNLSDLLNSQRFSVVNETTSNTETE